MIINLLYTPEGLWVSENGRVFIEKPQYVDSKGYKRIKHNSKSLKVHRLVANAFIENEFNMPQVNHKDGNKANNHADNLEWVNNSINVQHAYDNNLIDRNKKRLLSDEAIKTIRQLYIAGDREFGTRALARKFNVSPSCISYCIKKLVLNEGGDAPCIATVV